MALYDGDRHLGTVVLSDHGVYVPLDDPSRDLVFAAEEPVTPEVSVAPPAAETVEQEKPAPVSDAPQEPGVAFAAFAVSFQERIHAYSGERGAAIQAGVYALQACRARGGTACIATKAFSNECGALFLGDEDWVFRSARWLDDAFAAASSACQAATLGCEAVRLECARPGDGETSVADADISVSPPSEPPSDDSVSLREHYQAGRYEDALRLLDEQPAGSLGAFGLIMRAALYAKLGRDSESKAAVERALSAYPSLSVEWAVAQQMSVPERTLLLSMLRAASFPTCAPPEAATHFSAAERLDACETERRPQTDPPAVEQVVAVAPTPTPTAPQPDHRRATYGALAVAEESTRYAFSEPSATRAEAEADAMRRCKIAAGPKCKAAAWFSNACGAYALGAYGAGWSWGAGKEEVEREAMDACKRTMQPGCHVVESMCAGSPPT